MSEEIECDCCECIVYVFETEECPWCGANICDDCYDMGDKCPICGHE